MSDAGTPPRRPLLRRVLRWTIFSLVVAVLAEPALVLAILTNPRRGDAPPDRSLLAQSLPLGGLEQVDFATEDGLVLRGDRIGSLDRPVVVFGHGYRHRRRQGDPLAKELLARGYSVLSFDFRGSGDSDGAFTAIGAREAVDVRAALRHLAARGVPPERTAYVGFSMGGAAALLAGGALADLAAVVVIAPYNRLLETFERRSTRFGVPLRPWLVPAVGMFGWVHDVDPATIRPIEGAPAIAPAPLLILGARDDWRAPPDGLEELYRAANEPKRLEILPRGNHLDLARLGPEVRAPIIQFLETTLAPDD
ncbi:MAG: alpha/beta hydrolase [Planctomycetota bacterium JB042]